MKTNAYALKLGLKTLCPGDLREITGCYIGDLLSWVMSRAREGQVWLTVMSNVNVAAVAAMTEVACVVLCENAIADDELVTKAEKLGLPLYATPLSAYELAKKTAELLK